MLVILGILGVVAYLQAGYQIGRASADVWDDEDNDSAKSFLLFPTSHMRGNVGEGDCLYSQCGDSDDRMLYLAGMAVGWPVKVVWNAAAIAMLGPVKLFRQESDPIPLPKPEETRALPEGSPAQRIAALLAERDRIDAQIDVERLEVISAIETEETVDPRVREVIEKGLKPS